MGLAMDLDPSDRAGTSTSDAGPTESIPVARDVEIRDDVIASRLLSIA